MSKILLHLQKSSRPAQSFLDLDSPIEPSEAQAIYNFFWEATQKATTASATQLRALAKCVAFGAQHSALDVHDIMLKSFVSVHAMTSVQTVSRLILQHQKRFILVFLEQECIGLVWDTEIQTAIRHRLNEEPVLSITHCLPLFLPSTTSQIQALQALRLTNSNVALITQAKQIVGYIDSTALLGRTTKKKVLPADWFFYLKEHTSVVRNIGILAEELTFTAYLVGGFVRDYLEGEDNVDIDCCVEGNAVLLGQELHNRFGGSIVNNALFGASHWTTEDGVTIDLTSTRTETYAHLGALPTVAPSHLLADFQRRDFTINAMAICITPARWGELVDPYGGEVDLSERKLKVLHGLSFLEDPTRILRAARYAGRYNLHLDSGTERLIHRAIRLIKVGKDISLERIGSEFGRIFCETTPFAGLQFLLNWDVFSVWFPSMDHKTIQAMKRLHQPDLHTLLSDAPVHIHRSYWTLMAYAFPEERRSEYTKLIATQAKGQKLWNNSPAALEQLRCQLSPDMDVGLAGEHLHSTTAEQWLAVCALVPSLYPLIRWWLTTGQHIVCAVDGRILLQQGCPSGPTIGLALKQARRAAWRGAKASEQLKAAQTVWQDASN